MIKILRRGVKRLRARNGLRLRRIGLLPNALRRAEVKRLLTRYPGKRERERKRRERKADR